MAEGIEAAKAGTFGCSRFCIARKQPSILTRIKTLALAGRYDILKIVVYAQELSWHKTPPLRMVTLEGAFVLIKLNKLTKALLFQSHFNPSGEETRHIGLSSTTPVPDPEPELLPVLLFFIKSL